MSKILIFLLLITTASSIPIFFPVISRPHITKKEPSVPSEQTEADNCSICDFIINRSEEMITAKTTYEDALHIMKTACNHLPKIKYNSCNEMISENAKRMIAMIAKKEDTVYLGICGGWCHCDEFMCLFPQIGEKIFVVQYLNLVFLDIIWVFLYEVHITFANMIGPNSHSKTGPEFVEPEPDELIFGTTSDKSIN